MSFARSSLQRTAPEKVPDVSSSPTPIKPTISQLGFLFSIIVVFNHQETTRNASFSFALPLDRPNKNRCFCFLVSRSGDDDDISSSPRCLLAATAS